MILSEGRKEDIYNKYKNKIEVERKLNSLIEPISIYDILIDEPYIKQTNYKFLEPIMQQYYVFDEIYPREGKELEELEPNTVRTSRDAIIYKRQFVENLIPKIEFFERNKGKYPKKDLRDYVGLTFDDDFLNFTDKLMGEQSRKKEEKSAKKEADKIYEDNKVLIVSPKTHDTSCFYGSGTRWCVTMKNTPSHFTQYTTGKKLYFVILKGMSQDNPFYKIAINLKFNEKVRNGEFYDAQDRYMSNQEKQLFMTIAPEEAIAKIQEDIDKSSPNIIDDLVSQIDKQGITSNIHTVGSSSYKFGFRFDEFQTEDYLGDMIDLDEIDLDNFQRFSFLCDIRLIEYLPYGYKEFVNNTSYKKVDYNGLADGTFEYNSNDDTLTEWIELEEHDGPNFSFGYNKTYDNFSQKKNDTSFNTIFLDFYKNLLSSYSMFLSKKGFFNEMNRDLLGQPEFFGGPGYTFSRKGQLVTKLFNILDTLPEGKTMTKNEFFEKSGTVKFTPEGNFNKYGQKIKLKGYLASWFAALSSAKIIEYEGRKGFKKGPRYEEFKKKIFGEKK